MAKTSLLTIFLLLTLSGCRVGPSYQAPYIEAPEEWKTVEEIEVLPPEVCNWWEVFQDEILDDLEQAAIQNNPNVYVALARIDEAWANVGINRSNLFPQIDLSPSYHDTGVLFKYYLPPGGAAATSTPIPMAPGPFRIHAYQWILPFTMSWELDIWGQFRDQVESAYNDTESKVEAYRGTLLSLTSDLASSYFNLRFLDETIEILQETIETRRKNYSLTQSRYSHGLTNFSDTASASVELFNTESDYYDAVRQRGLLENLIATLIGVPASDFHIEPMPLLKEPPVVPAGIPSTVLKRRPDVAEAERTMAAQHGQMRAAYASFFPTFELTAYLGFFSPTFADFLSWKSRLWSVGAAADQFIFDGWKKESNFNATIARFAQATKTYQQQVLTAFEEVENALNNLEFQKKESDSLKRSVDSAEVLLNLSSNRYQQGLINYTEVVVNQRTALDAKRNYVNALSQRYQSTIQLIKALGGGWALCD